MSGLSLFLDQYFLLHIKIKNGPRGQSSERRQTMTLCDNYGRDRQTDGKFHVLSQADALTKMKMITDWNTSSLYKSSNLGQHMNRQRDLGKYEIIS